MSEFTLTINKSDDNNGNSMLLGISEDNTASVASSGKFNNNRVWGLAPWNGKCFGFVDACVRSANRSGELRGESLIGGTDFRGRANGAVVRVRVDADARRLYFKCAVPSGPGGEAARKALAAQAEWYVAKDSNGPIELPSGVVFCDHSHALRRLGTRFRLATVLTRRRMMEGITDRQAERSRVVVLEVGLRRRRLLVRKRIAVGRSARLPTTMRMELVVVVATAQGVGAKRS